MERVENVAADEEATHFEQFLLLLQCFQMPFAACVSECTCMQVGKCLYIK